MAVGNVYVYEQTPSYNRYKIRITKDTVVGGKRFFYFSQSLPGFSQYGKWLRVDGATGVLTALNNNNNCNYLINEKYVDSLKSRRNDSLRKCGPPSSACFDTSNVSVFGIPTKQKAFREDGLVIVSRYYSKYFGLTKVYSWEIEGWYDNLIGCKISGVTYGDTLLTDIENISGEIPSSYSLGQNYPNPFNPMTNVKFSIVNAGNVKLVVYDIQGREVQTLVNERMNVGTYEVRFDGSMLNSGVYFYKLIAGDFTETKRMIFNKII